MSPHREPGNIYIKPTIETSGMGWYLLYFIFSLFFFRDGDKHDVNNLLYIGFSSTCIISLLNTHRYTGIRWNGKSNITHIVSSAFSIPIDTQGSDDMVSQTSHIVCIVSSAFLIPINTQGSEDMVSQTSHIVYHQPS